MERSNGIGTRSWKGPDVSEMSDSRRDSLKPAGLAAVLTGTHSHADGQMTNADTLDGSQPTFPKLLRQAGYETAHYRGRRRGNAIDRTPQNRQTMVIKDVSARSSVG